MLKCPPTILWCNIHDQKRSSYEQRIFRKEISEVHQLTPILRTASNQICMSGPVISTGWINPKNIF